MLIGLAACSSSAGGGGGVQWQDYKTADLKSQIDALASAKDCAGLQEQFNNADTNNTATMNRTGHNNAELMRYIDARLRDAGCY